MIKLPTRYSFDRRLFRPQLIPLRWGQSLIDTRIAQEHPLEPDRAISILQGHCVSQVSSHP